MNSQAIIDLLQATHYNAAERDSASTVVFKAAYEANGNDFPKACVAALSTFGGKHAPIKDAETVIRLIISGNADALNEKFKSGVMIPGLGNSFTKLDPTIDLMVFTLSQIESIAYAKAVIESIGKPKNLYVNLAFCTAAVNVIHDSDDGTVAMVMGRMEAWGDIIHNRYEAFNLRESFKHE
jgi:hypothetical protein